MPLIEFVGQTVQDSDNVAINTGRLINCYRERVLGQGKTLHVLNSVLGMDLTDDLGAATVRAMGRGNQKSWVVGDGTLFELADAGTLTSRGSVADDAETTIDGNYTDVTVVAGGNYYVWDGTSITQPSGKTFTTVGSHCYIGGYTVLTEEGGKRFQWSGLGDATSLNALHFASAERVDDNIVRGLELGGNLVLMCERSTELWQVTGLSGAQAFGFVTSYSRGLRDLHLVAKFDDSLFYVGNDNNVYVGIGGGAVDVTTPAVNTALENNTPTHCFYYEDEGHKFCVIRFSDRPAYVFDVKMQEWHERAEGAGDEAWRAVASVKGTEWMVGNTVGEIYKLERTNKDLNGPLRRTAISRPLYLGDSKFRVNKIEANARVGDTVVADPVETALDVGGGFALKLGAGVALKVAETDGAERAAQIGMYESRDGGRTWRGPYNRSMGKQGDYEQRMVWRARGQFNQYAAKIVITEEADIPLNATAVLEVV